MRLHRWNRAAQDIEFDPESGSASLIKLDGPRDESAVPVGFAQFERTLFGARQVFAVFRRGDSVIFAAGSRLWQLDQPDLRLLHSRPRPFCSRFSVIEGGGVAFSILYSHVGRLFFAHLDPTYDRLDEETDFFLSFVAEYGSSPEWQANVLERWLPGRGG